MTNNERELGYSCDIALERLLELYATSSEFKRDYQHINTQPELIQYRQKQLKKERRREPLVVQLIKNRDNYSRLTKEWRHDWKVLVKHIPQDVKLEFEKVAEKWGFRCDWGCGFIEDSSIFIHPLKGVLTFGIPGNERTVEINLSNSFMVSPGPPNSTTHLTTAINIEDNDDSIKQKLTDLKKRAKTFRETTRKNLGAVDYRGFEKQAKKDITTQVRWLFWHVTPPYLSAAEIATRLQNTKGDSVDQFYIQRCYQNMAKLLGIKLIKGWPKGRRRASQQTRADLRGSEIEAKIGLENDQ